MAASERIIYQSYVVGKRGNLAPGKPVPCRNAGEAIRPVALRRHHPVGSPSAMAEKALATGAVAGAHVARMVADEDAGDFGEPEYLASLGIIPEPE